VDDAWRAATVAQISRAAAPCTGSALVDSLGDAGKSGYRVRLAAPLPPTVVAGAPVRVLRDARFALYRSSTGDWYLGWTDWNVTLGRWNVIQPVAGAYLAYQRAPGASGLSLVYHDSMGVARPPSSIVASVAAVGATLRTETAQALHVTGLARVRHRDSLDTRIAARNRR
jgi:hypothetical protein